MTNPAAATSARPFAQVAVRSWSLAAGTLLGLTWIGAKDGGYFPYTWGWIAVVLAWLATLRIVFGGDARLRRLELVVLSALTAFVAWVALSYIWSETPADTVTEVQRAVVYPLALLVVLLILRRAEVAALLGASTVAIVLLAGYGLATRLLPERLGSFDSISAYRLSAPLGYWNALGILAVLGVLLTLGFATRGQVVVRALAASGVVLVPTLYFTFSRGAIIALGIGLAALLALSPRRLQLTLTTFVVAPWGAAAVWLASRSDALTTVGAPIAQASREGHRLGYWILALAVGAGVAALLLALAEAKVVPGPILRRGYAGLLVAVAALGLLAITARYGDPVTIAQDSYNAFRGPPVGVSEAGSDLNTRLFSLSSNGRTLTWEAAWVSYRDHQVFGAGAGSFETYWSEHRPIQLKVRDAHSLYVEVLAELGPIGLGLLLIALGTPLVAAVRTRKRPLVPFAAAAYVAWLAHIGVDWDWEMPVVILAGLFCAAGLLASARREEPRPLPNAVRFGVLGVVVVAGVFAFVGLIGNSALEKAETAEEENQFVVAEREARKAARWAPWSAEPWKLLADVQEESDTAAARRSLRIAVEKEPYDFLAWYQLARASSGAERRRALAQATRLNPLSPLVIGFNTELRTSDSGG